MPSWTPCGGGRRGGLNRPRFDTKKLWLPSGSPHPRHPGPLRLQPADLLLLRGRQPSRSPPATRACTKTVRRWVASSQRITGASSPVPFLEHSWGRRGAAQPVRRCPSPLPHLVRARFRGPFPWGKSGPGWAHLAIGHPHHPAKALVTRIGVRPEGNTREDPRSDVCPSQKHLTVRERGVEPPRPFGHTDLNRARLPFRHSRPAPWGASRKRVAQEALQLRFAVRSRPFVPGGLTPDSSLNDHPRPSRRLKVRRWIVLTAPTAWRGGADGGL